MEDIDISTGEYAAHHSLTDLYDDCKDALAKALASGKDFHTEWGCKKEINYCDIVKRSDGWVTISVTCNMDDLTDSDDLVFDAAADLNIGEEKLTDEVLSQIRDGIFYDGLGDSTSRTTVVQTSSIDDVIKEIDRLENEAMDVNNHMYERLKDIVFHAVQ